MQLEPCKRPSRNAARPHRADTPARYSSGAASCSQGEAAPASVAAADICLPPPAVDRPFSCRKTRGKSAPLRVGNVATLSAPLPSGVRLLPLPLPASASVGLAACLPRRDEDGFTTFRRCTVRRLGRASPPRERRLRAASSECRSLSPCLLAQACQPLWPVITNGVYQRFTCVDRTSRSWFPTALRLAVAASAHAPAAIPWDEVTLSRGLRTPPLPATHAPVGYCRQNSR